MKTHTQKLTQSSNSFIWSFCTHRSTLSDRYYIGLRGKVQPTHIKHAGADEELNIIAAVISVNIF